MRPMLQAALACLTCAAAGLAAPAVAAAPEELAYAGCVQADIGKLYTESARFAALQASMRREFAGSIRESLRLRDRRNRLERIWLEAYLASDRGGELTEPDPKLRAAYEDAQDAERRHRKEADATVAERHGADFADMERQTRAVVQDFLVRERQARLYDTKSGALFASVPGEPASRTFPCIARTDVTDALMRQLDAQGQGAPQAR